MSGQRDPFNLDELEQQIQAAINRSFCVDGMSLAETFLREVGDPDSYSSLSETHASLQETTRIVAEIRSGFEKIINDILRLRPLTSAEITAWQKLKLTTDQFLARLARFRQGLYALETLVSSKPN